MSHKPEYDRGYCDGSRFAITWLHGRAHGMNDPHAKALMNSAGFDLGLALKKTVLPDHTPEAFRQQLASKDAEIGRLVRQLVERGTVLAEQYDELTVLRTQLAGAWEEAAKVAESVFLEMKPYMTSSHSSGFGMGRSRAAKAIRARAGKHGGW